jgi:hypothetical protein
VQAYFHQTVAELASLAGWPNSGHTETHSPLSDRRHAYTQGYDEFNALPVKTQDKMNVKLCETVMQVYQKLVANDFSDPAAV